MPDPHVKVVRITDTSLRLFNVSVWQTEVKARNFSDIVVTFPRTIAIDTEELNVTTRDTLEKHLLLQTLGNIEHKLLTVHVIWC
jgi:hypothetical protein